MHNCDVKSLKRKGILFISDLSHDSFLAFIELCRIAKNLNINISLSRCHRECCLRHSLAQDCAYPVEEKAEKFLNFAQKCNISVEYLESQFLEDGIKKYEYTYLQTKCKKALDYIGVADLKSGFFL